MPRPDDLRIKQRIGSCVSRRRGDGSGFRVAAPIWQDRTEALKELFAHVRSGAAPHNENRDSPNAYRDGGQDDAGASSRAFMAHV